MNVSTAFDDVVRNLPTSHQGKSIPDVVPFFKDRDLATTLKKEFGHLEANQFTTIDRGFVFDRHPNMTILCHLFWR